MKKKEVLLNSAKEIITRYAILLAIPFISFLFFKNFLSLFYVVFRPLTIWPITFILKFFYPITSIGTYLIVGNFSLEIIDACIAGSAYFLLLILNLTTPSIKWKTRAKLFIFDSLLLLLMNIARIVILTVMAINASFAFDITHKLFWYGISTIYVIFIWLISVWIFKIKKIPLYSDIKFLISSIAKKK